MEDKRKSRSPKDFLACEEANQTFGHEMRRGLIYKIKSSDATNMDDTAMTVLGAAASAVAAT